MNKEILKLNNIDQSVWIDSISRGMINTGKIKSMVENGVSGITSNPSIFQKALSNEDSYDEEIKLLTESGINDPKKYFKNYQLKIFLTRAKFYCLCTKIREEVMDL